MNLIEADRLARETLAQYNVPDTTISWDNSRSRLGVCKFTRNNLTGVISKRVIFSRVLFRAIPESEQIDTILHEIAHARLPHTAGHGPQWKAIHRAMGGNGRAEYKDSATVRAVARWVSHCSVDTSKSLRLTSNRLTQKQRRMVCTCHRQTITWKANA